MKVPLSRLPGQQSTWAISAGLKYGANGPDGPNALIDCADQDMIQYTPRVQYLLAIGPEISLRLIKTWAEDRDVWFITGPSREFGAPLPPKECLSGDRNCSKSSEH